MHATFKENSFNIFYDIFEDLSPWRHNQCHWAKVCTTILRMPQRKSFLIFNRYFRCSRICSKSQSLNPIWVVERSFCLKFSFVHNLHLRWMKWPFVEHFSISLKFNSENILGISVALVRFTWPQYVARFYFGMSACANISVNTSVKNIV